MNRMKSSTVVVLLLLGAVFSIHASRKEEVTLVLVPREDGPVRVGMDVAKRYPILLISYKQGANGAVSLNGWTGSEWVNITPEAYSEGDFFHTGPTSALIVGKEQRPLPESIVPSMTWCPSVYAISTLETRPLLHLMGRYFDFKYKDWTWFSSNYHMTLDSINPEGLNVGWYHRSLVENLKKPATVGSSDLQYWMVIRQPGMMEQMEPEVEVAPMKSDEPVPNGMEQAEALQVDPLTNAVPDAVVLGAGDADEAANTAMSNKTGNIEIPEVQE